MIVSYLNPVDDHNNIFDGVSPIQTGRSIMIEVFGDVLGLDTMFHCVEGLHCFSISIEKNAVMLRAKSNMKSGLHHKLTIYIHRHKKSIQTVDLEIISRNRSFDKSQVQCEKRKQLDGTVLELF
jgi:hypothetical protein